MDGIFYRHLQELLEEGQCFAQEPMGRHTTFRAGGPADYYVRPARRQIQPVLSL